MEKIVPQNFLKFDLNNHILLLK